MRFRSLVHVISWCGVLVGLAACAAPPAGPFGGQTVRRATLAGTEVRVAAFARWNEKCEQAGLPDAVVVTAPAHGVLAVRQAVVIAGGRRFSGETNCRDKAIPGVEVWYTPIAGFRGTDRMGYDVDAGSGVLHFVATVDVR